MITSLDPLKNGLATYLAKPMYSLEKSGDFFFV